MSEPVRRSMKLCYMHLLIPPTHASFWRQLGLAALLACSGCASYEGASSGGAPGTALGPAKVSSADRKVASAAARDRVLFDYRAAATALRTGKDAEAKARLDDAIALIGGIITNSEDAKRARSLFSGESEKTFIGEPYERVMAYYYRGILYWRDGEPDNARACFRSAQLIDSDSENAQYKADYVLLDYLEGLASVKLEADGSDSYQRAQERAGSRVLPPYTPTNNVLIFAEYGYGPRKIAAGQYGEQLRFVTEDSPTHAARLVLDNGQKIVPLPAFDDLGYQAATRGGRVMDHILGNKAVFKSNVDAAGNVALVGAVIANDQARRRERQGRDGDDANLAAVGLGILGLIGKAASAATTPNADTRQWDNLPQRLSFATLALPPGEHAGTLQFLDRSGNVLERRTRPVTLSVQEADRDTVIFLSELKY